MKPRRAYLITGILAALMLATLIWACSWLVGTTEGTRWLLGTFESISAERVEGRLLDHLRLGNIRAKDKTTEVTIRNLELRCQLWNLLTGRLDVQSLTLDGVSIRDNSQLDSSPPDLTWPTRPMLLRFLSIQVDRLKITGANYRLRSEPPLSLSTLTASVTWDGLLLTVKDMDATAPGWHLTGKAAMGLTEPFLYSDLLLRATETVAAMNRLQLRTRLHPGHFFEQIAGQITLTAGTADREQLKLSGNLGMTRHAVNLRTLTLAGAGRRGSLTVNGKIDLAKTKPKVDLELKALGVDLAPELVTTTDLSGTLKLAGTWDNHRGAVSLVSRGRGIKNAGLTAEISGDGSSIKLDKLQGRVLGGALAGGLDATWKNGLKLRARLAGSRLNPAAIAPDWRGAVNFDLTADLARLPRGSLSGAILGNLRESALHGQALTGNLDARFEGDRVNIAALALRGNGFNVHAAGNLEQRIDIGATIADLSRLVPGATGAMRAKGWVNRRVGRYGGAFDCQGSKLAVAGVSAGALNLKLNLPQGNGYPLQGSAAIRGLTYGGLALDRANLDLAGTLRNHTISTSFSSSALQAVLALSGGYDRGHWQGALSRFTGRDQVGPWSLAAPARLILGPERTTIEPLTINGVNNERLRIEASVSGTPPTIHTSLQWSGLRLSRANQWFSGALLNGTSDGTASVRILPNKHLDLQAEVNANGSVTTGKQTVTMRQFQAKITAGERGSQAQAAVRLTTGGELLATFSSPSPATLAMPEKGTLNADWNGMELALLKPWLPEEINLAGQLSGKMSGHFLPGGRLAAEGTTALSQGKVSRKNRTGELAANLRSASAAWSWRDDAFSGNIELALAEHGQMKGTFRLPLAARLPAAINPRGPVQATLSGRMLESGLLTALFPGFVRESSGTLDVNLRVAGTWQEPDSAGTIHLDRAGAYLPTAGVRLKNVRLDARLAKDTITIDSFHADSGPGSLAGTATLRLEGQRIVYSGAISGDRFQTIYLPEMRVQCTPKLTFSSDGRKLTVLGDLRLAELLINGPPSSKVVGPSEDVIIEGRQKPTNGALPLEMDVRLKVSLGDKAEVRAEGINATLGGAMDLTMTRLDRIVSKGEIRVIKGTYRSYGVNLDIVRGRLYYDGVPISQPTLDILALRAIGDVKAGVTVSGVLRAPVIKLYSDPTMTDVDTMAYIVFGHPLGVNGNSQFDMLAQAAGALLSSGQASGLQDAIRNRLGLSTLGFETTDVGSTGTMGYKVVKSAPASASTTTATSTTQSLLTVGKYLTPHLYLSYGRSLFTGSNLLRLRYDLFKRWQIETQTGTESGADLYYKIEFD